MITLTKRNLKLYFKDKGALFFSLLGVIVIFCLYIFFVGDSQDGDMANVANAQFIMDSWMMAGMIAAATMTTSMGAYNTMVTDKSHKNYKDLYASPLKRNSILGGYLFSGLAISIIMSLVTFLLAELYIVNNGGDLLNMGTAVKVIGVIVLTSLSSSALICFITSLIKTPNAFSNASIVIGTLIGFLVGAYVPLGHLPTAVQGVIKAFPCAHGAALLRQLMLGDAMETGMHLDADKLSDIKKELGILFQYGDWTMNMTGHLIVIVASAVLFYALGVIRINRKKVA
ncbi:MAG: ABC transporter permease [Clostridiales bacterium]|nr:ABC transporter permease [Clostridiales bacterium]